MRLFMKMVLLSTLVMSAAIAVENPWDYKLPFKSATIKYEVSGMQSGTEVLHIDDYGKRQARFTKTSGKVLFQTMETDKIEITTEDWFYTIDMTKKSGSKTTNPAKHFKEEYEKLTDKEKKIVVENSEKMGTGLIGGMQGTVEKNAATILGYKVDKTTVMGTTAYTLPGSGIALKMEMDMMGMSSKTVAVELKKGSVPANVFTPPKEVKITFDKKADGMMRSMAQNMMQTLKDPEAAEKMQQQSQHYREEGKRRAAEAEAAYEEAEYQEEPESSPYAEEEPDQQQINEAVEEGLKALKGLFGN